MDEQRILEEEQSTPKKEYGTGWMQFLYTIGMMPRMLIGLACVAIGFQSEGIAALLGFVGIIYLAVCGFISFVYWKNRWIGVYPKSLYIVTLVLIWTESAVSLVGFVFNPFAPIGAIIFAVFFIFCS